MARRRTQTRKSTRKTQRKGTRKSTRKTQRKGTRKVKRQSGGTPPAGWKVCMGTDGICYGGPNGAYKQTKDSYCNNPKAPQC
jgi:hypothetical protein